MKKNKEVAGALPAFKTRNAVLVHLNSAGYKVSRGKLYGDFEKKLIRMEPDGSVLEIEVRNYAVNQLTDGYQDIQALKNEKEVEKLNEQIAKLRFERKKEEGKYIPKKDFEAELAARAAVFDSGFRHAFNVKGRELIALVGGKPDKAADFLAALNQILDDQLTTYATTKVFQVMFLKDEE